MVRRKGRVEQRERIITIKKRKALATDTVKCRIISDMFTSKGPGQSKTNTRTTCPAWLAK